MSKLKRRPRLLAALRRGFAHRLVDRAAEHELAPEQLDRAHRGGDDRVRTQALEQPALAVGLGQEALGHRDRARRQAGQHLVRAVVPLASKSARPSWSAVRAIAVSASGTRSSASARRISARPSALEIGYSRSSDSMAQNGAGVSRTACTHGRAAAAAARQSSVPWSGPSSWPSTVASSRYGDGRRAAAGGKANMRPPEQLEVGLLARLLGRR